MNQPRLCAHYGRSNLHSATFCAACGARLASTGKGGKILLAALAVFVVGLLWAAAGYKVATSSTAVQPQTLSTQIPVSPTLQQPSPTLELTSAQHLAEARRALVDGHKPNTDPKKAGWGEGQRRAVAPEGHRPWIP